MDIPETRYAMTEDAVSIAYSTLGQGPVDLVVDPSDAIGNIEVLWEFEPIADLYRRLASFSRVILHDRRGCGLSGSSTRLPDLETRARDLLAVLDACGYPSGERSRREIMLQATCARSIGVRSPHSMSKWLPWAPRSATPT